MVVIDVLRWSTVVIAALDAGAAWVEAVATPAEALALRRPDALRGGERGAVALPGFDLGNSPAEYTAARVAGRGVISTTTNGTQGLLACAGAASVRIGAFANLGAVVRGLGQLAPSAAISLLACGSDGDIATEDLACAGAMAAALGWEAAPQLAAVLEAWQAAGRDARRAVEEAAHGRRLRALGFGADLDWAAQVDRSAAVPMRHPDGRVRAHGAG